MIYSYSSENAALHVLSNTANYFPFISEKQHNSHYGVVTILLLRPCHHPVTDHSEFAQQYDPHLSMPVPSPISSFYIILTGHTSVYIDTAKSDEDIPAEKPSSDRESFFNDLDTLLGIKPKPVRQEQLKQVDRTKLGRFIMFIGGNRWSVCELWLPVCSFIYVL